MHKQLYRLGFLGYLVLLVLAIIYYKERTIFTDNAYHLFAIIREKDFAFQNFRYGAALTQAVPLIGSKLGLSLNTILLLYSTCFIVYYTLCYIICGSVFRNYTLALALLLFNILFATDTFFWMLSELPQGVAMMCVMFSWLSSRDTNRPSATTLILLFTSLASLLLFFHPLMIFPAFFALAYFYLYKELIGRKTLLYSFACFGIAYLLKVVFFVTEYERHSVSTTKKLIKPFTEYFTGYANEAFISNCLYKYHWLVASLLLLTVLYVQKRAWLKLALVTVCTVGYIVFINNTYGGRDIPQFYIENLYLPVGLFLALPLVFDVLPLLTKRVAIAGLLLLIVTSVFRIQAVGRAYTGRIDWERRVLRQYGDKKVLVSSALMPADTMILSWGTAYEFWLLSTVEQGKSASIVIHDSVHTIKWMSGNKKHFVSGLVVHPYKELPPRYFKFSDTTSAYIMVEQ